MKSNKSRRLRKKLYLDEFAIFGLEFSCELNLKNEEDFDSFLDQFIDFIESRNLCMGGGGNTESFDGFICSDHRYGSASSEDRDAISGWLELNKSTSNVVVGQLVDANYEV